MIKVDCKQYAEEILERVKAQKKQGLYIIRRKRGDAGADSYVKGIIKDCIRCGIPYKEETSHRDSLEGYGGFLWDDPSYDGGIDRFRDYQFFPAVVEAILHVMGNELDTFTGKKVLVIGRSEGLGMPLFNELINRDCTVTLAHSKTIDLHSPAYLTGYDVIVTAVGKPKLIDLNRCFADLVIDVGISRDENGKLCGDCYNFDPDDGDTMKVATLPGGVGLVTRAVLLDRIRNK
jgi:methylenetetrahydrofolate dehydrogenase (NADP+)/methenyltetrahydrofolate cyclohydrolase